MSNNECILCSCEINNELNFLEFPQNHSKCKCKYFIHNNCINEMKENWANKCPICFVEFSNNIVEFQQPIEIIVDNNTQFITADNESNRIARQKCCCCLKFLMFFLILFSIDIIIIIFGK